MVCEPLLALVVSQGTEYGAAVSSAPALTPSNWNCTPTTPTLSEALALTVIVPETVAPAAGEVMLTDEIGRASCRERVVLAVAVVVLNARSCATPAARGGISLSA